MVSYHVMYHVRLENCALGLRNKLYETHETCLNVINYSKCWKPISIFFELFIYGFWIREKNWLKYYQLNLCIALEW